MHTSNVFLLALLAFIAGVGARSFFEVDVRFIMVLAAGGSFFLVYYFLDRSKTYWGIAGMLLIVFAFGIVRFSGMRRRGKRQQFLRTQTGMRLSSAGW